jgi:hypothetical protein
MGRGATTATADEHNDAKYWHRYSYRSDGAQFDLSLSVPKRKCQIVTVASPAVQ